MIDLIVPTVPGREASLERCLSSFESLTDLDLTTIIVRNSETCGKGWLEGLESSNAPYVALVADDIECASGTWAEVCIETVEEGLLPCPRVWRPDGGIESQGGDMNAPGHILARHRKHLSPTDFTTVPFMSREQVEQIGMIPTQYGCDVWVSYRGRQLGYDTVLCHGYDLIHHQEQVARGAGMDQNERDALDTKTMAEELAHASHTATLRKVMEEEEPQRILELGAGNYSTKTFLEFPVERVLSLETDEEWLSRILKDVADNRLTLKLVSDPAAELPDLNQFDLVFVDNSDNEADRERAIRAVLSAGAVRSADPPTVVIHDADHPPYRSAIEELTNGNVTYSDETPQTAVVR